VWSTEATGTVVAESIGEGSGSYTHRLGTPFALTAPSSICYSITSRRTDYYPTLDAIVVFCERLGI